MNILKLALKETGVRPLYSGKNPVSFGEESGRAIPQAPY